jgi:hypothetical protein
MNKKRKELGRNINSTERGGESVLCTFNSFCFTLI